MKKYILISNILFLFNLQNRQSVLPLKGNSSTHWTDSSISLIQSNMKNLNARVYYCVFSRLIHFWASQTGEQGNIPECKRNSRTTEYIFCASTNLCEAFWKRGIFLIEIHCAVEFKLNCLIFFLSDFQFQASMGCFPDFWGKRISIFQ